MSVTCLHYNVHDEMSEHTVLPLRMYCAQKTQRFVALPIKAKETHLRPLESELSRGGHIVRCAIP